jgi:hypothetical protein
MFRERLAEALQIKGWTQLPLARVADVSQSHLSLLLRGQRDAQAPGAASSTERGGGGEGMKSVGAKRPEHHLAMGRQSLSGLFAPTHDRNSEQFGPFFTQEQGQP